MKKIPLTQGKFATVDDEDYDWLMEYKWHYEEETGYAATQIWDNGERKYKKVYMHDLIAAKVIAEGREDSLGK